MIAQASAWSRAVSFATGWGGAAGFLAIGVAGWLLLRRIAAGLAPSLLVGGISLGIGIAGYEIAGQSLDFFVYAAHAGAGLCLLWAAVVFLMRHREHEPADNAVRENPLIEAAEIGALTAGLLCLVILIYVAGLNTLDRVLNWTPDLGSATLSPAGLVDLAAIVAAIALATSRRHYAALITPLFWTLCFAALWLSLTVRPATVAPLSGPDPVKAIDIGWPRILQIGLTAIICAFVGAQGQVYRRRRYRAWPNRMNNFTLPYPDWTGFRYSVGVISIALITLACLNLGWWATFICCGCASAAVFYLTHRKWSEGLGDTAAALATVAVTSFAVMLAPRPGDELADVYPSMFNYAIFGMTVMTVLWFWLSRFWSQQLRDGAPWTTAGRMIPIAGRFSVIVAGLAVVVAAQLAFWPKYPQVSNTDDTTSRIVTGVIAFALLSAALFVIGVRRQSPGPIFMGLMTIALGGLFVWVRLSPGPFQAWLAANWPVLPSATGVLLILIAVRNRRNVLGDPLIGACTVVLPAIALAGLVFGGFARGVTFITLFGLVLTFVILVVNARPERPAQ